jgi:hypothetical protein
VDLPQIVRCLFGKHQHSRRISRDDAGVVRSRCVGCGRRMIRVDNGPDRSWQVAKKGRNASE